MSTKRKLVQEQCGSFDYGGWHEMTIDEFLESVQSTKINLTNEGYTNLTVREVGDCDTQELAVFGWRPETIEEQSKRLSALRKKRKANKTEKQKDLEYDKKLYLKLKAQFEKEDV